MVVDETMISNSYHKRPYHKANIAASNGVNIRNVGYDSLLASLNTNAGVWLVSDEKMLSNSLHNWPCSEIVPCQKKQTKKGKKTRNLLLTAPTLARYFQKTASLSHEIS